MKLSIKQRLFLHLLLFNLFSCPICLLSDEPLYPQNGMWPSYSKNEGIFFSDEGLPFYGESSPSESPSPSQTDLSKEGFSLLSKTPPTALPLIETPLLQELALSEEPAKERLKLEEEKRDEEKTDLVVAPLVAQEKEPSSLASEAKTTKEPPRLDQEAALIKPADALSQETPKEPAMPSSAPFPKTAKINPAPPSLPPFASPGVEIADAAPTDIKQTREEISTSDASESPIKEISINFNNVAMVEYIRFISRISNKNFIFDEGDLQFNVTIVSQEPTSIENLMAALLQELRIRDLALIEQGNNLLIHRNPRVRSPARIVSDQGKWDQFSDSELITKVFRLNTLDPVKASEIIRPLLSDDALIEVLKDSNNLIITDLNANVYKISELIHTLDAPNSGVTIGQYVVRNAFVDSLVDLANKILQPIAQGNPFVLVPHPVTNSIFIVSNGFIVEKAIGILQHLDLNEGKTKILSLEALHPSYDPNGRLEQKRESDRASLNNPSKGISSGTLSEGGSKTIDLSPSAAHAAGALSAFANAHQVPESFPFAGLGNEGASTGSSPFPLSGGLSSEGKPSAIFDESRNFLPGGIGSSSKWMNELPVGHIERTLFFIYKLRYRKGDNIEIALRKIANSLQLTGTANADLISAINSSQWIESSNALIFTGTAAALEKVRELILEVDVPLRQVFIEMLILDTTITDSLSYSVDWINRFGGGATTGEEGFIEAAPGTGIVSADRFLVGSETILSNGSVVPPAAASPLPVATGFLNSGGFVAGVIGTHLTHNGTRFSSIGALVRAIHSDTKADIVLNPKIITEDNNPAEIFVGGVDRYKTQSITNDLGSLVTNNFQFIDVGTTLRVTPLIGNNGIITLEIVQDTTNEAAQANTGGNNQDVNLVPVLTKTRTVTKVHVPNGFFVVLSGMIQDNQARRYTRIPCLGGIPIIGCMGKTQFNADNKRNLMIFIRPLILDTDEDYEDVTKRQQDVFREKSKFRRSWNYEVDEALNFASVKPTDPDDMNCSCNMRQKP